jgi:hypothetical protein
VLYYLGVHRPAWLGQAGVPLFVSLSTLRGVQKPPRALARWALDSGAYTEIARHGGWRTSPEEYARAIARIKGAVGKMDWAAPQDWTCDPSSLKATGLTVRRHQRLTLDNYLALRRLRAPVIPVLQGWTYADYIQHANDYMAAGVNLRRVPIVGIGSIARRGGDPMVAGLVHELARSGLSLHGFGVKWTGLSAFGRDLASADSTAWSTEARLRSPVASDRNSLEYALEWYSRFVERMHTLHITVENGFAGATAPKRPELGPFDPTARPKRPRPVRAPAIAAPLSSKSKRPKPKRPKPRPRDKAEAIDVDDLVAEALRKLR